jgi:hypothetical protein
MTCSVFVLGDYYEIQYDPTSVLSIVRYRHGLNSSGELVTYDELPVRVQTAIYHRLAKALRDDRRRADAGPEPETLDI